MPNPVYHRMAGLPADGTYFVDLPSNPRKKPRIYSRCYRCGHINDISKAHFQSEFTKHGTIDATATDCWECRYCRMSTKGCTFTEMGFDHLPQSFLKKNVQEVKKILDRSGTKVTFGKRKRWDDESSNYVVVHHLSFYCGIYGRKIIFYENGYYPEASVAPMRWKYIDEAILAAMSAMLANNGQILTTVDFERIRANIRLVEASREAH